MTKLFLAVVSIMFLMFGVYGFIDPGALTSAFGVEHGGVHGLYEARGLYGGVHIAFGVLTGLAVIKPSLQKTALILLVTYFSGYVFARFGAMGFGMPEQSFYKWIAFEVTSLICAALLLRKHLTQ